nr:hypothetical protein [uncultured Halomonas sp.]
MIRHLNIGTAVAAWFQAAIFLGLLALMAFPFIGVFWSLHLVNPFQGFSQVWEFYDQLVGYVPLIALILFLLCVGVIMPWLGHEETEALDCLLEGMMSTLEGTVQPRGRVRQVVYRCNRQLVDHYIEYLAYTRAEAYHHELLEKAHIQPGQMHLSSRQRSELGLTDWDDPLAGPLSFYTYLQRYHPMYALLIKPLGGLKGWHSNFLAGTCFVSGHHRSGHYRNTASGLVYVRPHSVRSHTRHR